MLEGSFAHKLPFDVDWISVARLKKEMKATAQERVTVEENIVASDEWFCAIYLVIFWLPRERK